MFSHIVLATDFSPSALLASHAAHAVARAFDAKVTLLHCFDDAAKQDTAGEYLEVLKSEHFGDVNDVACVAKLSARPFDLVVEQAGQIGADLVVVGRHGEHQLSERLIGSTSERVVRHAPCSVLVTHPVRREGLALMKHIMAATDFSDDATHAADTAAALAKGFDAAVTLSHVWDLLPPIDLLREPYLPDTDHSFESVLQGKLDKLREDRLDGVVANAKLIRHKSAVQALCDAADLGKVDLLVVGTHGLTGIRRLLIGSVAERMVRHAPCSVLVARADPQA
jgi:nucleotide-binding universal stress UspA family protein